MSAPCFKALNAIIAFTKSSILPSSLNHKVLGKLEAINAHSKPNVCHIFSVINGTIG